ncbi:MAG: hypothetical protein EPN46_03385 [Candidimonas sp.]|nr:MAG: hypothetical protein EPN77_11565 [Candidimonas sp.]TAM22139.1 MAG: hypothetical protein EPN62_12665 [Candidimonas sp.]TAM79427.1 MAG: hypothetical protein EPN46_03385 [Candidimonas sp.]
MFKLSLLFFALSFFLSSAYAGDLSWTDTHASPAISVLNKRVVVAYSHTKFGTAIPTGSTITLASANQSYAGNAVVQTLLCWNGTEKCIPMSGSHVNTHAFDGLAAGKTMYLMHRVLSWGSSFPPLIISGNVNIWFTAR